MWVSFLGRMCQYAAVAKLKVLIPKMLPTSPINLVCPFCSAKPGHDCATTSGGLSVVHVARIGAAALVDKPRKRKA